MKLPSSLIPVRTFLRNAVAARVVILFIFHALVFAASYSLSWMVRFEFAIPPD